MTTYLGKSCSFGLLRVPFVNCGQFMYLVISLFGFEDRMWDLIVSVPVHCLSFYFVENRYSNRWLCHQLGQHSTIRTSRSSSYLKGSTRSLCLTSVVT